MAPSLPFLTGRSLVRPLKKGRVSLDFYDEKRRLKEELRKSDLNPLSPVAGSRGTPLKKHHTQTYLAIVWFSILVTYVILIEYCVHAHNLPLDIQYKADDGVTFGQRGTSTRRTVVQAFTVIRTILTAAHVPIMTGTLAATLPALTQRVKGKNPLKLTASQLFLLADRSWGGAGGWYEAFLVGKLPWTWWRLFMLTVTAFFGFPLITLGYETKAEQYWDTSTYNGVRGWTLFGGTVDQATVSTKARLDGWIHEKPQRNLGDRDVIITVGDELAFYPPANDRSRLGHFVTISPKSNEGLVVSNTLGFIQDLKCRRLAPNEAPKHIDMTEKAWGCQHTCNSTNEDIKGLCYARASLGIQSDNHLSQIVSCGRASNLTTRGISAEYEIALKINPDYETYGIPFPTSESPYSFRAGDSISGSTHYVDIISCQIGYIPGHAIVDSIIRRFMHFLPFGLETEPGSSEDDIDPTWRDGLEDSLRQLLNVTIAAPTELLHEYFLQSPYASITSSLNSSLPFWFGVQKPNNPFSPDTKATAARAPLETDTYPIDNMSRVNGPIFQNSFLTLANSSLVHALRQDFFLEGSHAAFIYKTDVKIGRGALPIVTAPVILLIPVCIIVYLSIANWRIPVWTEFLDAFAMFRLGRDWKGHMEGTGAMNLSESFQARTIPGFVGDVGDMGDQEFVEVLGQEYVGHISLGGGRALEGGRKYA